MLLLAEIFQNNEKVNFENEITAEMNTPYDLYIERNFRQYDFLLPRRFFHKAPSMFKLAEDAESFRSAEDAHWSTQVLNAFATVMETKS
jgi:hypothetical protein